MLSTVSVNFTAIAFAFTLQGAVMRGSGESGWHFRGDQAREGE